MINRFLLIISTLFYLIRENALADEVQKIDGKYYYYNDLGSAQCPGTDQISHSPPFSWKVGDAGWIIDGEDRNSKLTQFSGNTNLQRTVLPYHVGRNLADVICAYSNGSEDKDYLTLKRTYSEKNGLYPEANYIVADTNLNKMSGYFGGTSCDTVLSNIQQCEWHFYYYGSYGHSSSEFSDY